jgi:glycosyltransferase involved in cell wall biosynthesis
MLDDVTPVLLTYNEAPNIARTLTRLNWARDIIVVDSHSTDKTVDIVRQFPQVRVFIRSFDTHGNQWRYAIEETGINTKWVLRLDADYLITEQLKKEMSNLSPTTDVSAYRVEFDYAIYGHRIRTSLYPANTILLRKGRFKIIDQGHTERWLVEGKIENLAGRIVHDDRKAIDSWISSQSRYMTKELNSLDLQQASVVNWFRRHPPLMPIAVFLYCFLVKGLIFSGRAGLLYAMQRATAETILSMMILEGKLIASADAETRGPF